MTTTPRRTASLSGVETERKTLEGLDGRPLSSSVAPSPSAATPLQPDTSQRPDAPIRSPETPLRSKAPEKPTTIARITMDASQGLPNAPRRLAEPSLRPQDASTSVVERSSQERTHFNAAESALPAALADSALGAAQYENALTSKAAERSSFTALRRHPAVWFLAGSTCTLLLVLVVQSRSGEPVRSSESATSTEITPAHPPARSLTTKVAASSVEPAARAASTASPGAAETGVATQADPADETNGKDPVTVDRVKPRADETKAAAPPVRTQKRRRSSPQKRKSFIPRGL